jgi:hypothetical protein
MEHPLIPNIDNLTTEELLDKVNELHKKFGIAHRLGNYHLCNQIRMAIETYQNKYTDKLRASQSGKDTDGIIDIS